MPDTSSKPFSSVLAQVPANTPLYERLARMQLLAMAEGWQWPDIGGAIAKTEEELAEVKTALAGGNRREIVDELGDLIFMATLLCHYAKVDPMEALAAVTGKFTGRFGYVERKAAESGRRLSEVPHAEERQWYAEYKAQEKKAS